MCQLGKIENKLACSFAIEIRVWSIEWRHFQWSWRTPNPDFKVTPLFDAEYFQNGYRYGHCYYGSRI